MSGVPGTSLVTTVIPQYISLRCIREGRFGGEGGAECCGGDAADKRIWAINITLVVSFSVMKRVDELIDPVLW